MNRQRRQREKLLFRYTSALERGDFETVGAVLREAERDPRLEQMILEVNEVLQAEARLALQLYEKEHHTMNATMTYTRPGRYSMALLLTALALVVLVGAALFSGVRNPTPEEGSLPAAAQVESATPAPLDLTATPVPTMPPEVRGSTLFCIGIDSDQPLHFYALPSTESGLVAEIPESATLNVIRMTIADAAPAASGVLDPVAISPELLDSMLSEGMVPPVWFYVEARQFDAVISGWVQASLSVNVVDCPPSNIVELVPTLPPPVGVDNEQQAVYMTATAVMEMATGTAAAVLASGSVPSSTPLSGNVTQPEMPALFMTATGVILQATGTAAALFPPTSVPTGTPVRDEHTTIGTMNYVIQPGDTLLEIAVRFRLTNVQALRALNPDVDLENLPVGETLVLPFPPTAVPPDPAVLEAQITALSGTLEAVSGTPTPVR